MTSQALATFTLHDGGGLPLVLLHGFPLDHRMWAACAAFLPPGARAIGVDGAKHLWVGEPAVARALNEIVAHVLPDHPLPLPTHWDGPVGAS